MNSLQHNIKDAMELARKYPGLEIEFVHLWSKVFNEIISFWSLEDRVGFTAGYRTYDKFYFVNEFEELEQRIKDDICVRRHGHHTALNLEEENDILEEAKGIVKELKLEKVIVINTRYF